LTQRVEESLRDVASIDADIKVTYDVSHNIAKFETHEVHGSNCKCCVHRKGATRAFSGGNPDLADDFQGIGQPVLVPGDMGRASWVLAGPKKGENDAFSSSCHGAGRKLSRTAARNTIDPEALVRELEGMGIIVRAKTRSLLSEEAPEAYKNVDDVVRLTESAGLARPVARLRPLGVIKG
jgi:tRNA-splicing ligase RtcB